MTTVTGPMNRYGRLAMRHWARWLPTRLALIPVAERDDFFTRLGSEVAEQITVTEEALLATADLSGLEFEARAGRLRAVRGQAEEIVLAEMVWLAPEPGTDPTDETFQTVPGPDPLDRWVDPEGMPTDRAHPLWAMLTDETIPAEQFARAVREWMATLPRD